MKEGREGPEEGGVREISRCARGKKKKMVFPCITEKIQLV